MAAAQFFRLLQAGQVEEVLQFLPADQRTDQARAFLKKAATQFSDVKVRVVDSRRADDDLAVVILEVPRSNPALGVKYITRRVVRREGKWVLVLGTDSISADDPAFQPLMPWIQERLTQLTQAATRPAATRPDDAGP